MKWSEVTQSCPTLCDPVDCSSPGSSIHGILQVRILEWVAISFSRGSSQPRDWTWVPRIAGRHFNLWATREAKGSTWMQSQKWQNDLCTFPRKTIQYHRNPSLCPNQWCWRSWSWMVLLRHTRPFRTNTQKRCPFHYRGLECKSRKSRNTWSNRQIWPWNAEWSRAKTNRVLPR